MYRKILKKAIVDRVGATPQEFEVLKTAIRKMHEKKPAFAKGETLATKPEADRYHLKIRKEYCDFLMAVWHSLPYALKFDPPTDYCTTDGVDFRTIMEYVGERVHEFLFFKLDGDVSLDSASTQLILFPTDKGTISWILLLHCYYNSFCNIAVANELIIIATNRKYSFRKAEQRKKKDGGDDRSSAAAEDGDAPEIVGEESNNGENDEEVEVLSGGVSNLIKNQFSNGDNFSTTSTGGMKSW